jgi:hypothetical protein
VSPGSRPGAAPAAAGAAIALQILAARLALSADEGGVWLFGAPLGAECAFRARFGLPCPTCGMTRSLILALHGEPGRAWALQPAGPVAVAGLVLLAVALLVLGIARLAKAGVPREAALWIRRAALIYAAGLVAVWLGGWGFGVRAALAAR